MRKHKSRKYARRNKKRNHAALLVGCSATALVSSLATTPAYAATMEEVIVTAQKRDQSVLSVPYNITAESGQTLKKNRVDSLAGLSELIAGFSYINQGATDQGLNKRYSLRGIEANPDINGGFFPDVSVPPVSMYYGDHPINFNLAINDLKRIEVLRGPQGTLYGSGSLGGTIRFIPNEPELGKFEANFSAENSFTKESGGQSNYDFDSIVNIPIGDTAALRLGGGKKYDAGFIQARGLIAHTDPGNPFSPPLAAPRLTTPGVDQSGFVFEAPKNDVNDSDISYVRLQAKYVPTNKLDLLVGYEHENVRSGSQSVINPNQASESYSINDPYLPGIAYQNKGGAYLRPYFGHDDVTTYPATTGTYQNLLPQLTPAEYNVDVYTADVHYDLGFATVTSATTVTKYDGQEELQARGGWVSPGPSGFSFSYYYGNFPRFTTPFLNSHEGKDETQELRLVSTWDKPVDYVFGLYYTDQEKRSTYYQVSPGVSAWAHGNNLITSTGTTSWTAINKYFVVNSFAAYAFNSDVLFDWHGSSKYYERAAYGQLTWHLTPQWQVMGGFRFFSQDDNTHMLQLQPLCGALCSDTGTDPSGRTEFADSNSHSNHIFSANTSYHLFDNLMIYANWAEGFRRGGVNYVPTTGVFRSLKSLARYRPDETRNFEIGAKGIISNRFTYSVAAYLIKWSALQVDAPNSAGFIRVLNAGNAESKGFEVELDGEIVENLTFRFAYAYTDAHLTQAVSIQDYGFGGNRLHVAYSAPDGESFPGSLRNSASWGINYVHPMGAYNLDFHLHGSYRGKTATDYSSRRDYFELKGFTMWGASVALSSTGWTATLFVDNLTNALGSTARWPASQVMDTYREVFVARPRTIGLKLSYDWK